jgi:hypothetical protein
MKLTEPRKKNSSISTDLKSTDLVFEKQKHIENSCEMVSLMLLNFKSPM